MRLCVSVPTSASGRPPVFVFVCPLVLLLPLPLHLLLLFLFVRLVLPVGSTLATAARYYCIY